MALLDLANPTRFLALSGRLLPWTAGAAVLFLAAGLALAFAAPADYQQGETVRIMYIHVPFAWLAMFGYSLMAASALGILVWRHPLADVSHKAAAPIGATFTFLCLVTGALWGRPMWGTYWVWDARLTSVLVLFLLYLGLMALRAAIDDTLETLGTVGAPATWVLSNHDVVRHVSRFGRPPKGWANGTRYQVEGPLDLELGQRRARCAALLTLSLPGGCYVYQGEELGLAEVEDIPEDQLQDPIW